MMKLVLAVASALILSWTVNADDLSQHSTDAQKAQARALVDNLQPKVDQLHQSYQADLNAVTEEQKVAYCKLFIDGFKVAVHNEGYSSGEVIALGFTCDREDVVAAHGDLSQAAANGAANADVWINKAINAGINKVNE